MRTHNASVFDEIVSRVAIRDILADLGISADKNRIACPIHGGNNKTSFSFTDSTFICHACGAGGGLLALVEYLHECEKQEAMNHLCKLAGVSWTSHRGAVNVPRFAKGPKYRDPIYTDDEVWRQSNKFEWLELLRQALNVGLLVIRRNVKQGKLALAEFYAREQQYLYELETLDPRIIALKHKVNEIKRRLSNDENPAGCS